MLPRPSQSKLLIAALQPAQCRHQSVQPHLLMVARPARLKLLSAALQPAQYRHPSVQPHPPMTARPARLKISSTIHRPIIRLKDRPAQLEVWTMDWKHSIRMSHYKRTLKTMKISVRRHRPQIAFIARVQSPQNRMALTMGVITVQVVVA